MRFRILLIFFLFVSASAFANDIDGSYYWIQFKDKKNSPFSFEHPLEFLSQNSIDRRIRQNIALDSTDLPVNPIYIEAIESLGLHVKFTSRWLNGAIAIVPPEIDIDSLTFPEFISGYELRKPNLVQTSVKKQKLQQDFPTMDYGHSAKQVSMLNGDLMHLFSKGEGVTIGILDAGFVNVDVHYAFDSLRNRNGILGTYDFVNPGNDVYREHYHGASVLSCIAGNVPNQLIGTATQANFWLLRSEDVYSEYPVEEDYWIVAAEFADSVGCDVINSSLGYSEFDDSTMNHPYEIFNGKTLRISQAANMAVDKGIIVCSSAGNEGNNSWHYIIAPAEAENVLAVAAVDSFEVRSTFSSYGFPFEGFPKKPDVSAQGTRVTLASSSAIAQYNGTSFSSPLMAGIAACLVKLEPNKTAHELTDLIRSLGNNYPNHDTSLGYGIPRFENYLKQANFINSTKQEIQYYFKPSIKELVVDNCTKVRIFNTWGEIIKSENILPETPRISLANLNSGIYLILLEGEATSYSFKIFLP